MGKTIESNQYGSYNVYEFDEYPEGSVLEGQTRKSFIDMYDSASEALREHPDAELGHRDAHNHFDHLPDDGDSW